LTDAAAFFVFREELFVGELRRPLTRTGAARDQRPQVLARSIEENASRRLSPLITLAQSLEDVFHDRRQLSPCSLTGDPTLRQPRQVP